MADISVYRLTAVGPSTLKKGVVSDSVSLESGEDNVFVQGQNLTPHAVFTLRNMRALNFSQAYVDLGPTPAEVASFGAYWQAYDETGVQGTGGISVVGNALVIPLSVRASKGDAAVTAVRALFLDSAPTVGTTTKTPQTTDAQFMIGPTTVGGNAVTGIESQEIAFNTSIETDVGQSGKQWPTTFWFPGIGPVITIVTTDLALVDNYITGATLSSNACTLKFQNQTGSAGYQYTVGKAYAQGSISGAIGTLVLTVLNDTTTIAGAAY